MILVAVTDLCHQTHYTDPLDHQMLEESDGIFPLHGDLYHSDTCLEQISALQLGPVTRPAGDLQQIHRDHCSMWT